MESKSESMKVEVAQSCPTLCDPISHHATMSMGIPQARILEWVAMSSFRSSSNPGIKPPSLTLQVDSLLSESPGKLVGDIRDMGSIPE